jgi:chromosome segregation ATPase
MAASEASAAAAGASAEDIFAPLPPPLDFASVAGASLELDVLLEQGKVAPYSHELMTERFAELQRMVEFADQRARESEERFGELRRVAQSERIALEAARLRTAELLEESEAADGDRRRVAQDLTAVEALVSASQADGNELVVREKEASEDLAQMNADNKALVQPALAALARSVADLREEASMAQSTTEQLGEQRGELRRKVERLTGDTRALRASLEALRIEQNKLAVEPARLAKQMLSVEELLDGVRAEVAKMAAAVAARDADVATQARSIEDVSAFRAELERKTARHRADLDAREQEMLALERALRGEKSNYKGILERRVEMQGEEERCRSAARAAQGVLDEATAAYERAKKELKHRLERVSEAKIAVQPMEAALAERELELRTEEEDLRRLGAKSGAVRREMDGLLAQYLREEGVEKKHRTALAEVAESCAALEAEKEAWAAEEALAIKQIAALKVQRDNKSRELETTVAARKAETEKARLKEIELGDLSKQLADSAARMHQFSNLYELAKSERNSFASAIQSSHQGAAEMRERLKILKNEVEILHSESAAKDKALAKERQALAAAGSQRDGLRSAINKSAREYQARQLVVEQQILGIDKLSSIIDGLEADMNALKLQYEAAVEMRSFTGIQLIDRNDELCVLYEKSNVHEKTASGGEKAMRELDDECRALSIALKELERQQYIARMKLPDTPMWAERILEMQNALVAARQVSEKLCAQLETPAMAQRWIALDGEDPDSEQLGLRAAELEQSLGLLKQELLDRELSREELRGLSERLSAELHGAAEGGPAAAAIGKQVNELRRALHEATRRLMALVSEVSMYQAEALKLGQEAAAAADKLSAAQDAFDRGLPPSVAAEQRWGLLERQRQYSADAEAAAREATPAGPEPRPNAYVPDDGVGLPRPFGKHAPFKAAEASGGMRHFHAPVLKPIDL